MPKPFLLSFLLSFLALLSCYVARQQQNRYKQQQEAKRLIQGIDSQKFHHQIQSEAGISEFWDWKGDQLRCVGVAIKRDVIQPRCLFFPSYTNTPSLTYIIHGKGIQGVVIPGCSETYQEERARNNISQQQHEKTHKIKQGDIIALRAGIVHWTYNDGETDLVAVLEDTTNTQNQLDIYIRVKINPETN